jgi:formate hydrogenlyase subunit 6/NADH:ubiquinone oxidoreductase subunit I
MCDGCFICERACISQAVTMVLYQAHQNKNQKTVAVHKQLFENNKADT